MGGAGPLSRVNFFVIGAAKCGTTTVYDRLARRPDVFLSRVKEPNHYARSIDPARFSPAFRANLHDDWAAYFSRRPLAERQIGFIQDAERYAALFEEAGPEHRLVGECSTSYLWDPEAPAALHAAHPQAQVVVVLRHPVERLFSHYLMARKYGFTQLPLLEAVAQDGAHPDPGWGRSELFEELGHYAPQLRRWLAFFPLGAGPGRLQVLLSGDLRDPSRWAEFVASLGLPVLESGAADPGDTSELGAADRPAPARGEDANRAGLARFEKLNHWMTRRGLKRPLGNLLPAAAKARLLRWYYTDRDLPRMTPQERAALLPRYAEDTRWVAECIGRDLSPWMR